MRLTDAMYKALLPFVKYEKNKPKGIKFKYDHQGSPKMVFETPMIHTHNGRRWDHINGSYVPHTMKWEVEMQWLWCRSQTLWSLEERELLVIEKEHKFITTWTVVPNLLDEDGPLTGRQRTKLLALAAGLIEL